jgi:putative addiction module killer protein
MFEIIVSERFEAWLRGLRDRQGRARITAHLVKMGQGNLGDIKPVGSGVSEVRLHFGPGYRLYFLQKGRVVVVMLCGGDKSTQAADIADAIGLAGEWKD